MKAMILAAGLGTRLRPLTNDRPKALVELAGQTLLEITLARLRDFGIHEVIINVHHFANMVMEYLAAHDNFGMRIEISREDVLLDTGGGLKKAAWFFVDDSRCSVNSGSNFREGERPMRDLSLTEPFIVHNVDVISNIDLRRMVEVHTAAKALATLAVQQRETSRQLLFDDHFQLCGRRIAHAGSVKEERVRSSAQVQPFAFSGIHVISPRIFEKMTETGSFSIIDAYLRLAREGEKILAYRADEYIWQDLGKLENVAKEEGRLRQKLPT